MPRKFSKVVSDFAISHSTLDHIGHYEMSPFLSCLPPLSGTLGHVVLAGLLRISVFMPISRGGRLDDLHVGKRTSVSPTADV